jgi:hypothetical protein
LIDSVEADSRQSCSSAARDGAPPAPRSSTLPPTPTPRHPPPPCIPCTCTRSSHRSCTPRPLPYKIVVSRSARLHLTKRRGRLQCQWCQWRSLLHGLQAHGSNATSSMRCITAAGYDAPVPCKRFDKNFHLLFLLEFPIASLNARQQQPVHLQLLIFPRNRPLMQRTKPLIPRQAMALPSLLRVHSSCFGG